MHRRSTHPDSTEDGLAQVSRFTPFLLFVGEQCGRAEAAIALYTSAFKDSRVDHIERWGPEDEPEVDGTVKHASFSLDGQEFMAQDSALGHQFTFTPALSIFVRCDSEPEIDELFARLSDGGQVLMELAQYPFSEKFAWLNDPFGVSWQLSLDKH